MQLNDIPDQLIPLFWAKVDRTVGECWPWMAHIEPNGYGRWNGQYAHRVAFTLTKGPIPKDLTLDHLCRVRHCVNPDHLEAVTVRENTLRGNASSAINAKKTACPRGHAYDGFNVNGQRFCRTCLYAAQRAYRQRKVQGLTPPSPR